MIVKSNVVSKMPLDGDARALILGVLRGTGSKWGTIAHPTVHNSSMSVIYDLAAHPDLWGLDWSDTKKTKARLNTKKHILRAVALVASSIQNADKDAVLDSVTALLRRGLHAEFLNIVALLPDDLYKATFAKFAGRGLIGCIKSVIPDDAGVNELRSEIRKRRLKWHMYQYEGPKGRKGSKRKRVDDATEEPDAQRQRGNEQDRQWAVSLERSLDLDVSIIDLVGEGAPILEETAEEDSELSALLGAIDEYSC